MTFSIVWALILFCSRYSYAGHFTNEWAVKLNGESNVADQLAAEMGYDNLGQIKGFHDVYLLRKKEHPSRSKREAKHLNKKLNSDPRVLRAEQQEIRERDKRDLYLVNQNFDIREKNRFNDELWSKEWYLYDTRNNKNHSESNMHVIPVWNMGYTGKGSVLTVMDDGLEWNHTDLIQNYDSKASWDSNDNDPDPFPRYDINDTNKHGTRCAGEIAMVANNIKCGVGVAYNSKVGGIRMLDGPVTDITEGTALSFNIDYIDIFSASWGPTDDGKTVDGPRMLAQEGLVKGVTKGRNGKGIIYVWAAGNGATFDNCNCDGYASSIYTLSIGSVSQRGKFPWYAEKCASTMASTYSSGSYSEQRVSTVHLHNDCTTEHSGTSASAPLAAGIIALVLEANSDMTWRDIQHLTVWTAEVEPLLSNKGWKMNSAGLMYNSKFGFGLINAETMVKTALKWQTVPQKSIRKVTTQLNFPRPLSSSKPVEIIFHTNDCKNTANEINYLEHVLVLLSVDYPIRGVLDLYLVSPSGTETVLLTRRVKDFSLDGFQNWKFLSVHLWGESPNGVWKLLIRDRSQKNLSGLVRKVELELHGTKEIPRHMTKKKVYLNEEYVLSAIDPNPEYNEDSPIASKELKFFYSKMYGYL